MGNIITLINKDRRDIRIWVSPDKTLAVEFVPGETVWKHTTYARITPYGKSAPEKCGLFGWCGSSDCRNCPVLGDNPTLDLLWPVSGLQMSRDRMYFADNDGNAYTAKPAANHQAPCATCECAELCEHSDLYTDIACVGSVYWVLAFSSRTGTGPDAKAEDNCFVISPDRRVGHASACHRRPDGLVDTYQTDMGGPLILKTNGKHTIRLVGDAVAFLDDDDASGPVRTVTVPKNLRYITDSYNFWYDKETKRLWYTQAYVDAVFNIFAEKTERMRWRAFPLKVERPVQKHMFLIGNDICYSVRDGHFLLKHEEKDDCGVIRSSCGWDGPLLRLWTTIEYLTKTS